LTLQFAAISAGLGLVLTVGVTTASGQVKPPGTVQPGQIERQFERLPEPGAKPGSIAIPTASQTPPSNAEGIRFVLNQLTVDGATVYTADKLRPLYANSLRKEVSLGDVYRIVDTITARYRNDGYILSQVIVPAQSVEDGSIRLQAVEGYVSEVRVEGGTAELRERVRPYGEKIRASRPLTAAVLERYVLLMNDLPGVQARAVLAPAQTPGAADLVLEVSRGRISAGFNVDNRGSESQGYQRLFADVDFNNLVGASRTELREVTTATPEMTYTAVAHDQFLGTFGGRVGVAGSYVYSRPQELSIVPLDLTTKSVTFSVTYTHPLIRSRARNLYLRGALSGFDSDSTIFNVADTTERIRAIRVGATFDAGDRFDGVNLADLEYSQGLQGLGASHNEDAFLSRSGRADFQKATLYAARIQVLPKNWQAVFGMNAQYAFTDLLSPELFSVGGEQFGRGYDPSQILNDHGAAVKLDLRYTHTWGGRRPTTIMPYAFVDYGQVWQRTPLAGQHASQSISSTGAGFRLQVGAHLSSFVEVAKPMNRIAGQDVDRTAKIYAGLSIQ
jgi:hemolysin activation/secretion protein